MAFDLVRRTLVPGMSPGSSSVSGCCCANRVFVLFNHAIPTATIERKLASEKRRLGVSAAFFGLKQLIDGREGLAPAVFADIASDDLAGFRTFEQRAVAAAINAIWLVLILRLLPCHFFIGLR